MKKFTKNLAILILFLFLSQAGHAQLSEVIPKSDMIKMMDDVSDLGIAGEKNDKLMKQNETFVNDLFNIVDGDQSEEEKKDALALLKKDNEKNLTDLLGDDAFKSYKKKMKKTFKPYKRKMKLLKFAL
jgi:hypothetical protein